MYTHRLTVARRTPARNLLSYILCITVSTLCWPSNDKNRQGIYHSDTAGIGKKWRVDMKENDYKLIRTSKANKQTPRSTHGYV